MESYIYLDGWKTKTRFSSAHIIPEYEKCGRLHGHTYAVHTRIHGIPDSKGIIIDFSILKETLNKVIKPLDHRILIPKNSKVVKIDEDKNNIRLTFNDKEYLFPMNDCLLLPIESTSAETLSMYILNQILLKNIFNNNIKKIEICVDEGYGQGAWISKEI